MFRLAGRTALAWCELAPCGDLIDVFERLRSDEGSRAHPWLLDSALPSAHLGRFSFAGVDPYLVLRARGTHLELECRRPVRPGLAAGRQRVEGDPFEALRALLPERPTSGEAGALPFVGGAVGYLGYELAECIDPVHFAGADDLGLPDLAMLFIDRLLICDRLEGRLYACGLGFAEDERAARERAERAFKELGLRVEASASRRRAGARGRASRARSSALDDARMVDARSYARAIDTVKERIAAGDVYQACLTHRIEQDFEGDAWALYCRLRRIHPTPFASFFELPELTIAGSSPERFLRLSGDGAVESRPIKGTRARASDPESDAARRRALETSEKERAENLMIVDLVRNDLGRVCETGSVKVPELMAIETYASVFQMVSTVTGRLRPECDAIDLVRASFPPGSMTGAPKIAAMRILEGLEPVRRGVYSGAIGYFDVRGGADLSVVIRTILLRRGRAYVHAGGGIVADSAPAAEYRETLDKARPLLRALRES